MKKVNEKMKKIINGALIVIGIVGAGSAVYFGKKYMDEKQQNTANLQFTKQLIDDVEDMNYLSSNLSEEVRMNSWVEGTNVGEEEYIEKFNKAQDKKYNIDTDKRKLTVKETGNLHPWWYLQP